ncbi:MAG: ATP-dependent DNA helicase RecG, partial [Alistipes sp.]|nr:ATP-dependent DNA helicase RecG [Alistipes sp.]
MGNVLNNSVKYIAGVGEARAKLLEKELGIITIGDLLRHYPFRYIDRTKIYRIADVNEQMTSSLVQIRARVTGVAYAG